jgi:hypothetical protein
VITHWINKMNMYDEFNYHDAAVCVCGSAHEMELNFCQQTTRNLIKNLISEKTKLNSSA